MRPLLRARFFCLQRLAKGERGSGEQSDVGRRLVALNVLFNAFDGAAAQRLAKFRPVGGEFLHTRGWLVASHLGPRLGDVVEASSRASQAKVRSTTHRHRPNPLPCSVLRLASKGMMWRASRPWRIASAS